MSNELFLRRFRSGACGDWIDRLLRVHRISRLRVRQERVGDYYDDPPLPSLLVVFGSMMPSKRASMPRPSISTKSHMNLSSQFRSGSRALKSATRRFVA